MLTTSVMLFPLKPFHSPLRTLCRKEEEGQTLSRLRLRRQQRSRTWQKVFILSSTRFTSGITSLPSTQMGSLERFLRATWSTARP